MSVTAVSGVGTVVIVSSSGGVRGGPACEAEADPPAAGAVP